mmetsp:Transcript_15676/g.35660  ORF Transcript_15676/g.35660 Transcript_15676/m.35660 type:complete len:200 (-) Transcript_15676:383-982(-)
MLPISGVFAGHILHVLLVQVPGGRPFRGDHRSVALDLGKEIRKLTEGCSAGKCAAVVLLLQQLSESLTSFPLLARLLLVEILLVFFQFLLHKLLPTLQSVHPIQAVESVHPLHVVHDVSPFCPEGHLTVVLKGLFQLHGPLHLVVFLVPFQLPLVVLHEVLEQFVLLLVFQRLPALGVLIFCFKVTKQGPRLDSLPIFK